MPGAVCCDTSFLFSLYGRDVHSPRAAAEVLRLGRPIALTAPGEYELLNAIRLALFRGLLPEPAGISMIASIEADLAIGRLVLESGNLAQIFTEAKRLSALHTARGGHRALDVLLVAAAVQIKAEIFLTFDANQRVLAEEAGLKVRP